MGDKKLPYNPYLKAFAHKMRNNSTKGEIIFWCELLRKRKSGFQFNRQKVIGKYIADFYCHKLKLVIEIDGGSHIGNEKKDKLKDEYLNSLGIEVIRFDDSAVQNNFHLIEDRFNAAIKNRSEQLKVSLR